MFCELLLIILTKTIENGNMLVQICTFGQLILSSFKLIKKRSWYRGYYMPACGYEFYLLVFNAISHKWAQLSLIYKHQWKRRDLFCNHNDGDLFTCENNMLFSRLRIWSFLAKAHLVFHWCLYIIKHHK